MLSKEEERAKLFMYNSFIGALQEILQEKGNKEKYEKWQGNCCRQTAIYGACILEQLLPQYDWKVWQGEMTDVVYGKEVEYDHAWIFGRNRDKRLLVDLSRDYRERVFEEVKTNSYPKTEAWKDMKILKREQLDWKKLLKEEREFYTGMTGEEIMKEISKRVGVRFVVQ